MADGRDADQARASEEPVLGPGHGLCLGQGTLRLAHELVRVDEALAGAKLTRPLPQAGPQLDGHRVGVARLLEVPEPRMGDAQMVPCVRLRLAVPQGLPQSRQARAGLRQSLRVGRTRLSLNQEVQVGKPFACLGFELRRHAYARAVRRADGITSHGCSPLVARRVARALGPLGRSEPVRDDGRLCYREPTKSHTLFDLARSRRA